MKGPHIQQDERIYGATLLDVTPTILTLFGLPVGEDMDGRVLVQAFEKPPEITRIPSWESEPGECGMHPADLRMDPAAAQAVLQQFVALGYIQAPSENQAKAVEMAVREQNYNLSRVYLDSGNYHQALPILEELVNKYPDEIRFQQHLAHCYLALGRRAEAKVILEKLIVYEPPKKPAPAGNNGGAAAAQGDGEPPTDEAQIADQEPLPAELQLALESAAVAEPPPPAELPPESAAAPPPPADLHQPPAEDGSPAADKTPRPRPWADLLMGIIHFEEGNMDDALACLLKAEQSDPRLPNLHLRIGETYLRRKRIDDAERAFQQALEIDGDSPEAHLGLAMVRLRQRRNEEAAEQALLAVGLQHFLPLGHFYLGVALARLGHRHRATLAFETAVGMLPGLLAAHRWLGALYSQPGGDLEKAMQHRNLYVQLSQQRKARVQA